MDRKLLVIFLGCVLSLGILIQPAAAGKYATAKPSLNKYSNNSPATLTNSGNWLKSIKSKCYDFSFGCLFNDNSPFGGWLLGRNRTTYYSSQHIVGTILDYEDYTHIYITYESKR